MHGLAAADVVRAEQVVDRAAVVRAADAADRAVDAKADRAGHAKARAVAKADAVRTAPRGPLNEGSVVPRPMPCLTAQSSVIACASKISIEAGRGSLTSPSHAPSVTTAKMIHRRAGLGAGEAAEVGVVLI